MAPKTINWAAIKKRYLQGEKPKDIAAHFGITSKQVSARADREKWKGKKEEIRVKTEEIVQEEIRTLVSKRLALAHLSLDTSLYGLSVVAKHMAENRNPYRQDGDGLPDAFFLECVKAGRKQAETIEEKSAEPEKQEHAPVEGLTQAEIMDRIKKITGE